MSRHHTSCAHTVAHSKEYGCKKEIRRIIPHCLRSNVLYYIPESVKLRIEKSRKPCATMDCGKYTFYPMGEIPKSLKLLWHKGQSHFLKMSFSDSCILFSHKIFSAMPKVKRLFRICHSRSFPSISLYFHIDKVGQEQAIITAKVSLS